MFGGGRTAALVLAGGLALVALGGGCTKKDSGPTQAQFEARFRASGASTSQAACQTDAVFRVLDADGRQKLYASEKTETLAQAGISSATAQRLKAELATCQGN